MGVMDVARVSLRGTIIEDPPVARLLFASNRLSWLWAIVRVWLGYQWLNSALGKVSNPAWVETGLAVKGFWERAVTIPAQGRPLIAFDWYRGFLQFLLDTGSYVWFGKLVAYGELLVGAALIVGAFVGIAAFLGAFMSWNFMMAGTASVSPVLFTLAVLLILAWKVAGYYGLDYYLLPALGTPWSRRQATSTSGRSQPA
jgi:thiosulfate dehydrogenase [quinone] large subunit